MRIDGLPPAMQQGLLAALTKVGEDFAGAPGVSGAIDPRGAVAAAPPTLPSATHPATSVEMLVAMAAAEPTVERRRKLAENAGRGLALLEKLHAQLVAGVVEPQEVQELVEWSQSADQPDDPQLAAIAREIELRVRVEIAKHELRV